MTLELQSERLILSPFALYDIDICIEMFTDPEVVKYADGVLSSSEIKNEIHKWTRCGGDGGIGIWCIRDQQTGEKFGSAALLPIPIEDDDTDFNLVVQFAFEGTTLNEVVATFDKENLASRHVLEKAGFRDHGTMRCYGEDGINFRITRDEWVTSKEPARTQS